MTGAERLLIVARHLNREYYYMTSNLRRLIFSDYIGYLLDIGGLPWQQCGQPSMVQAWI